MRTSVGIGIGMALLAGLGRAESPRPSPVVAGAPVEVASVLRPEALKKVLEEREVVTRASLDRPRYAWHVSFLARAPLARTRERLTEFSAYEKHVPYVDQSDYDKDSHILKLRGSIWKYVVATDVRFIEKSERWLGFEMVGGHFKGMRGEMIFEPRGEKGTLVLVRGEQVAREFPPAFVLEQGAQIVFGVTGKRMRSYVEALNPNPPSSEGTHEQRNAPDSSDSSQVPRPRRRL